MFVFGMLVLLKRRRKPPAAVKGLHAQLATADQKCHPSKVKKCRPDFVQTPFPAIECFFIGTTLFLWSVQDQADRCTIFDSTEMLS